MGTTVISAPAAGGEARWLRYLRDVSRKMVTSQFGLRTVVRSLMLAVLMIIARF